MTATETTEAITAMNGRLAALETLPGQVVTVANNMQILIAAMEVVRMAAVASQADAARALTRLTRDDEVGMNQDGVPNATGYAAMFKKVKSEYLFNTYVTHRDKREIKFLIDLETELPINDINNAAICFRRQVRLFFNWTNFSYLVP